MVIETHPDEVQLIGRHRLDATGAMRLRLRLCTANLAHAPGGIMLRTNEDVSVVVGQYEYQPPRVEVDHHRFLGHPHVLQGQRLCLYLDPSREWDPTVGFGGFLDRLFAWLADAAGNRFDAQDAMYHAVGGVLHATDGALTVVVRHTLDPVRRVGHGWLLPRAPHRLDLTLARPAAITEAEHTPVIQLDADLPLGAGHTLGDLLTLVDSPRLETRTPTVLFDAPVKRDTMSGIMLSVLGASAIRKQDGSRQPLVLAVPHPSGGAPHLLAANLPSAVADSIRAAARSSNNEKSVMNLDPAQVDLSTPLQWWLISDERPEVTTRRDAGRPVTGYAGKSIAVWGCGGLGSWIAEFAVRAGAARIVLCDPGTISGGLLVRQNFTELDVGDTKVDALARRLRSISDSVDISVHRTYVPEGADFDKVDLIVDATVSVAIGRLLDDLASRQTDRPVIAQVATDSLTGTIGMLTVSSPPTPCGPFTLDRQAGEHIISDGTLEAFHALWDTSATDDQIIPTRGCSTPTFHGAAADLGGVAASLTSILGAHLQPGAALSGTHLISLPHGEAGPLRTFVPAGIDPGPDAAAAGVDSG
ncbi:ThiF family adenylyltransferase [Mycobacterium sp. SMC-18]|uniref:ThiF family adenylyltransferase n=1 Tax=Mycobacterium sp. SMC-18 TaxID=3381629 RepID=UPI003876561E